MPIQLTCCGKWLKKISPQGFAQLARSIYRRAVRGLKVDRFAEKEERGKRAAGYNRIFKKKAGRQHKGNKVNENTNHNIIHFDNHFSPFVWVCSIALYSESSANSD